MNCCKSSQANKENSDNTKERCGSGIKHLLAMIVCCLAPLGAVLIINQSGYAGSASYLVFMLCPLMHLFMMKWMGHKKQEPAGK